MAFRMAERPFRAGEAYGIADMARYPWTVPWRRQQKNLDDVANLHFWFAIIAARWRQGHGRPTPGGRGGLRTRPAERTALEISRAVEKFRDDRVPKIRSCPSPFAGMIQANALDGKQAVARHEAACFNMRRTIHDGRQVFPFRAWQFMRIS
ncbi:glutathione S-transferase family protein [Gluconacetobacter tumulisoli]|uniref:Uncharacterized protein n=1 Tax=Gluconacetobacter tumulisoli TaxID=1286189 RepID=A0A7W4PPM5_9PROT|nr:hypothetical protein [Gluconacetobacter tumulisoli]